jgi:hypothetical protein
MKKLVIFVLVFVYGFVISWPFILGYKREESLSYIKGLLSAEITLLVALAWYFLIFFIIDEFGRDGLVVMIRLLSCLL